MTDTRQIVNTFDLEGHKGLLVHNQCFYRADFADETDHQVIKKTALSAILSDVLASSGMMQWWARYLLSLLRQAIITTS